MKARGFTSIRITSPGVTPAMFQPFGCCYESWLEPEFRERAKADLAANDARLAKLSRAELVGLLESLGVTTHETERAELVTRCSIALNEAQYPRRFFASRDESRAAAVAFESEVP